jgi:hypothetical protein
MIEFLIGFICGVAVICIVALRLAANKNSGATTSGTTVSAVSVDLSGKPDARVDAFTARRMNDIFRDFKNGTIQ